MKKIKLVLKQGATLVHQDNLIGLSLGGRTRLVRDPDQASILTALLRGIGDPEKLKVMLDADNASGDCRADAALAIMSFILDFEEYLEP